MAAAAKPNAVTASAVLTTRFMIAFPARDRSLSNAVEMRIDNPRMPLRTRYGHHTKRVATAELRKQFYHSP
ncbi:hypothetical protein GCM10009850_118250 [Nonomuraea monospora]|uniref:Secreted protein n=1 Tax=Nonomuraea monospora TaxID=568818 RepID=A0ABP5PX93_9ACTN